MFIFHWQKSYEELDKVVEKHRVAIQEQKLKGKQPDVPSVTGTPNSFSPHTSRPNSPKPASNSPNPSQYKVGTKLKEEPRSTGSGSSIKSSR